MRVLTIDRDHLGTKRLRPSTPFDPLREMDNRFRNIRIFDYEHVLYKGQAAKCARFLKEGTYEFEWID